MVGFRNTDTSGRTTGLLLRCVLYSLVALGLIIVDKRYDHLGRIRRALSIVAYPVQIAVASPFEGWDWFRESVTTRDALRADKTRLEGELRMAQFRLQRYEALEAESQRLRGLRDSTAGVSDRFVIGNVMDLDLDAFRERVLVDKGAQDGVFVGQAVLDAGGVFGQVARVGQLTAEVILVSDATHAIPVQVNRNGLRTVAVGTGDLGRLKLPYLPTSADVVVGDLLVTSGLGGGFPAGYPVGSVAEVKRDPAASLADVDVKPAAALDRSRELMFVWLKPQPRGTLPPLKPHRCPKMMRDTRNRRLPWRCRPGGFAGRVPPPSADRSGRIFVLVVFYWCIESPAPAACRWPSSDWRSIFTAWSGTARSRAHPDGRGRPPRLRIRVFHTVADRHIRCSRAITFGRRLPATGDPWLACARHRRAACRS
jgi:rod shape-determining protein MreC